MSQPLSRFFQSEVAGLAPWIAANLALLAPSIGLSQLLPIRSESPVGPFRLDLLAEGLDESGATVQVAIEVQLGSADHDHLGKLITYLAHQRRGVGVWVVDRATHPHLTAVDFLNRSTNDHLAWWLVTFEQEEGIAPDPSSARVNVLAGPGIPLPSRPLRPTPAGTVRSHPTRTEFLQDVLAAVAQPSMVAGWRNPRITNKGYAITWSLPAQSPLRRTEVKLRCHANEIVVHLLVRGYGHDGNHEVIETVRQHHGEAIASRMPQSTELRWHEGQKSADSLRLAIAGISWAGDAQAAPDAVLQCLEVLTEPVLDRRVTDAPRRPG